VSTLEHDHEHAAESHHLPPAQVARQQRQAVLFAILADAVFFACMLFTWFYLRSLDVDGGWIPDDGKTADTKEVWLIATVVVVSALAYRWAENGIRAAHRGRFRAGSMVGLLLVAVSIGLILRQAHGWPILMSDGSYASTFIVMTYVLLVHLVILLLVALGIWNRAGRGKLDDGNINHATLVGYFWYWLALTAILSACLTFFV